MFLQMVISMKVNFRTAIDKVEEHIPGQMVVTTVVNG